MQHQDPHHLLVHVAKILDELRIPYFITGGISVLVWGRPRFTADIDIVVEFTSSDIEKLSKALRRLGPTGYIDEDMMREALKHQGEFNFIDGDTGIKVDFWILSTSEFDQSRFKRRISKKILDYDVFFTSPEDLILAKAEWYKESQSSRQIEDIESVFKITQELDIGYLSKMAKKLGFSEILRKFINTTSD